MYYGEGKCVHCGGDAGPGDTDWVCSSCRRKIYASPAGPTAVALDHRAAMMDHKMFPDGVPEVAIVGCQQYVFLKDWRQVHPAGLTVLVPKGYLSDGASIPKPGQMFTQGSPIDYIAVAGPHDLAYDLWINLLNWVPGLREYLEITKKMSDFHVKGLVREWADMFYRQGLVGMGWPSRTDRMRQYNALRWFGWLPYYLHKHHETPEIHELPAACGMPSK